MLIYLPKEEMGKEFLVTKGGEGYFAVFEIERWNLFVEKLNELPTDNKNARVLRRHFLGSAQQVEANEEAMIVISEALYYYCTVHKNVQDLTVYSVGEYQKKNINIMQCIEKYAKYVIACE